MANFFYDLKLYASILRLAIHTRMQYRSDFFIGLFGVIFSNLANLMLIWIILEKFNALAAWSLYEVVLLYAIWLMSQGINALFFWNMLGLENYIVDGSFDQYLIRPMNPFLQFIAREVNFMGFGDIVLGVSIFIISYNRLHLSWSATQFLWLFIIVLSGTAILASIYIIFSSVSFWTGRSKSLLRIGLRFQQFGQRYPLDIFGQWYKVFVSFFFPIAFVNYYPLAGLLSKPNAVNMPILAYLSPFVAIILVLLAIIVWHFGINSYGSTGS